MPQKPPEPHVLTGLAARKMTWVKVLMEWIDNSLDKKATHIHFDFAHGALSIEDDGEGTDSVHDIVQLGKHTPSDSGIGFFGLGGSEALLWAGGPTSSVSIISVHHQIARRLDMNWYDYGISHWMLPDAYERAAEANERGTKIQIRSLRARPPRDWDQICQDLGYYYSHAIRRFGKSLSIRTPTSKLLPVEAWEPPEFEPDAPTIDTTITVKNRSVKIFAGVIKEGVKNVRRGLTYWYGRRVIIPESAQGCGDFSPARVCGFIELGDEWRSSFTLQKDGLTSNAEELFGAVETAIRPVLEAAATIGATFEFKELNHRLESRIADMLKSKTAKGKREKGKSRGTVKPKNTERTHRRANKEQAGDRFASGTSGKIHIDYIPLGGVKMGEAKPPSVMLNMDNPFIAQAVKNNREDTLLLAISSIIADWDTEANNNNQLYLKGYEEKSFLEQVGMILASAPELDGSTVLRAVK